MPEYTSLLELEPEEVTHQQARSYIKQLRRQLRRHNHLYYVQDQPEISDGEYDRLFSLLETLEEKFPKLKAPDSPTQRVGGEVLDKFEQAEHVTPLLSLASTRQTEDVKRFHDRIQKHLSGPDYLMQPKYDGLSVELVYREGRLERATTRGDGEVGEVITANVKTIGTVPLRLQTHNPPQLVALRGEGLILEEDFQKLNQRLLQEGEKPFSNPRNAAAGSLRQLDSRVASRRNLTLIAYDLLAIEEGPTLQHDHQGTQLLKEWGFLTPEHVRRGTTQEDILEYHRQIGEKRPELPFEIDGVVIKLNQLAARDQMGMTARHPRWALAIKYPPERATTTITDITVQVGRTGALTPVAEMKPVEVGGVTIQRATLHNRQQARAKDVRAGDRVFVQRAGDVIPEVVGRADNKPDGQRAKAFEMPETCPACGGETRREGPRDYCTNHVSCPAQLKAGLEHLASRKALDIEGLGGETVELLVQEGMVEEVADLWRLEARQLAKLEGLGEQSSQKLVANIQAKRSPALKRLLTGLGIPGVGSRVADLLARHFPSLTTLREAQVEELQQVEGIGPKMAQTIHDWFQQSSHQDLLDQLQQVGVKPTTSNTQPTSEVWEGKRFVFTGSLENFTRQEAQNRVEQMGGRATSSVSGATDYLIAGPGAGSKLEKARELDVEVLDEQEFLEMLQQAET